MKTNVFLANLARATVVLSPLVLSGCPGGMEEVFGPSGNPNSSANGQPPSAYQRNAVSNTSPAVDDGAASGAAAMPVHRSMNRSSSAVPVEPPSLNSGTSSAPTAEVTNPSPSSQTVKANSNNNEVTVPASQMVTPSAPPVMSVPSVSH